MRISKKQYRVDYETQWIHEALGPENALYFEPNTPIEKIIKKLENHINEMYTNLNANYQKSKSRFASLYGNTNRTYNKVYGWQVFYRKPNSQEDFYPLFGMNLNFAINNLNYSKADFLKHSQLKRPMLWKHELYPMIKAVKIGPVLDYATIAEQLKQASQTYDFKMWLDNGSFCLNRLNQNYDFLKQKHPFKLTNLLVSSEWQKIEKELDVFSEQRKHLNLVKNSFSINPVQVYDILRNKCKTAKGWNVEFLDKND